MNNPGLKKPISNAASQAKDAYRRAHQSGSTPRSTNIGSHGESFQAKQERMFTQPLIWWYAGTAFPLLAGTFGPMANAFTICALVEHWRVAIPPGRTEEHGVDIPDPKWLLALNSCALASALIANLFLLLSMARRVRFTIAQPVTILGFWIASIMHIVPISIASHGLKVPNVNDQALSQAYYYAIFGAALYQIISYLLCITVWGAYKNHYRKRFRLTGAQRTLMVQTVGFLVYSWLGALVYSNIEGWKFLDAIYWSNLTILTIGIGDLYVPATTLGRALLFPFALGGIISVGLVVGSIRSLILDKGRAKMSKRFTERMRLKVVKQIAHAARNESKKSPLLGGLSMSRPTDPALNPKNEEDELRRRMAEFNAMRTVLRSAQRRRKYVALFTSTTVVGILWTIGAVVFWSSERRQEWTYFESLYFSYTTLMTIGYGDFRPESNSGKPFFVFWSLLAVPSLTILISNMGDTAVKWLRDLTIWVGEVTLHPGQGKSTLKSARRKMRKSTRRMTGPRKLGDPEKGTLRDQYENLKDVHPELVKPVADLAPKHGEKKCNGTLADPKEHGVHSEGDDRERGKDNACPVEARSSFPDILAEQCYIRLLLAQVRKVYADHIAAPEGAKRYSYTEWAFFLKLMGEDENSSACHRQAPKRGTRGHQQSLQQTSTRKTRTPECNGVSHKPDTSGRAAEDQDDEPKRWSWLGERSPLIGPQTESQWILERLFKRLEHCLEDHWEADEHETRRAGEEPQQWDGTEIPNSSASRAIPEGLQ